MKGRKLGYGVAYGIVDGAFGHLATVEVHYRHTAHGACRGHSKHFGTVAENHGDIRRQALQRVSHSRHTGGHGLHGGCRGAVGSRQGNAGVDAEPGAGDFVDGHAVGRVKVHIGGHNLQLHVGPRRELAGHSGEQSPLGAGACDYAYLAFHFLLTANIAIIFRISYPVSLHVPY